MKPVLETTVDDVRGPLEFSVLGAVAASQAVYAVTVTGVERLRSRRRSGTPSLDWYGSDAARMVLSHLLINRVIAQRPSRDLQTRFAVCVLARLPTGGFALHDDDRSRWLRIAGDADDSAPTTTRRRSWLGRLLDGFGDASSHSTDA
jgi:hypothetical protein